MSYLALYRRYRPARFDELIGQEHIVQTLVSQMESGRIGHAYLFTGTRGTGKTTAAKIFAKAQNEKKYWRKLIMLIFPCLLWIGIALGAPTWYYVLICIGLMWKLWLFNCELNTIANNDGEE